MWSDVSLKEHILVREYATLYVAREFEDSSLDRAPITRSIFEFLVILVEQKKLDAVVGLNKIRLGSQVGYIETPCGIGIEILPKIMRKQNHEIRQIRGSSLVEMRSILQKMVHRLWQFQGKEVGAASLVPHNVPLHEWIFQQFLAELVTLMRRGLRRSYIKSSTNKRYIKGRLNIKKILDNGPAKAHVFPITYDQFSFNRIENQLLKSAVEIVAKLTKTDINWRLANELNAKLNTLDPALDPDRHLPKWEKSKLMKDYQHIYPWCEMILMHLNPAFQKGRRSGIALLFKMEQLFEAYVATTFELQLQKSDFTVRSQDRRYYLTQHHELNLFQLKPDLLFFNHSHNAKSVIIGDTKWKCLNDSNVRKYQISQSDLYQMLAYGYRYQQGNISGKYISESNCEDMLLIYPYYENLQKMLRPFILNESEGSKLRVWVIPFKLDIDDSKEGLVIDRNFLENDSPLLALLANLSIDRF